jgi:hypothetical protein
LAGREAHAVPGVAQVFMPPVAALKHVHRAVSRADVNCFHVIRVLPAVVRTTGEAFLAQNNRTIPPQKPFGPITPLGSILPCFLLVSSPT